jgi:hypothetical protein
MLSGETSVGHYPIESVWTMTRIVAEVESEPFAVVPPLYEGHAYRERAGRGRLGGSWPDASARGVDGSGRCWDLWLEICSRMLIRIRARLKMAYGITAIRLLRVICDSLAAGLLGNSPVDGHAGQVKLSWSSYEGPLTGAAADGRVVVRVRGRGAVRWLRMGQPAGEYDEVRPSSPRSRSARSWPSWVSVSRIWTCGHAVVNSRDGWQQPGAHALIAVDPQHARGAVSQRVGVGGGDPARTPVRGRAAIRGRG